MLKLETLNEVLAEKLSNPAEVLDLLITALAKGQHPALEWGALHAAASRDGLVGELASAYEAALAGRRIKLVSPANQAEAYLHAAEFFAERATDTDAAIEYAERALGAAPGHEAAFALLERVLRAKGDRVRLARAYLELAGAERDRDRQLAELRQAAGLLAGQEGTDELAIEVHQRILRVDRRTRRRSPPSSRATPPPGSIVSRRGSSSRRSVASKAPRRSRFAVSSSPSTATN
jgi:tetratricopeptide (TPR) repeat protein